MTKYRKNVLTGQHHDFLHDVFAKVCADFGATLTECSGEDDYVHLLVEYLPQVAVFKLVNSLNGVASRRLKQHFRIRTYRGAAVVAVVVRCLLRSGAVEHHPAVRGEPTAPDIACPTTNTPDRLTPT